MGVAEAMARIETMKPTADQLAKNIQRAFGRRPQPIERREPVADDVPRKLADRLARWAQALRPIWMFPRDHEALQRNIIYDLEVAVRILNLPEFAEWLRTHGDDTQSRFGAEMLEVIDRDEANETHLENIEDAIGAETGGALERAGELSRQAEEARQIRQVLEETGALAADDTDTDVPALVRALLS